MMNSGLCAGKGGLTMVHLRIKMKEKYLRAASVAIVALAACSMLLLTAGGGSAAAEGSPEDFSPMPAQEGMSFSPYRLNCTLTDPLPGGRLTDGFGWRYHPITGNLDFHYGDDYAAAEGTEIYAAADGLVTTAGTHRSYGNYLIIQHSDGLSTLYAHCSSLLVEAGQQVSAGETVALVGMTGEATGPHLHFEVIGDGVRYRPELAFAEGKE